MEARNYAAAVKGKTEDVGLEELSKVKEIFRRERCKVVLLHRSVKG